MADICEGLRMNSKLRDLVLRDNYLGPEGGNMLADLLSAKGSTMELRRIDVSFNSIGCDCARRLSYLTGGKAIDSRVQDSQTDGLPVVSVMGNFVHEELWNSVTHGIAFILSILGSVLLLRQVMDHCGILLLIAGSYSPFLLFYCSEASLTLMKAEWILAGIGIVAHVCSQYAKWGTSRMYLTAELVLYLAMGWSGFAVWGSVFARLPQDAMQPLIVGGLLYTAGVPFFLLGDYWPICHAIWHIFVVAAAIFHWFAVGSAAYDVREHYSEGPYPPEVEWYNEKVAILREQLRRRLRKTQDISLSETIRQLHNRLESQAALISGLAAWGNASMLERIVSGLAGGQNVTGLLDGLGDDAEL